MKLSSLLDSAFILPQAQVKTKEEAIDLILHRFSQYFQTGTTLQAVKQAILDREAQGGTVLDKGLAIPHARLESFNDFFVGIVIPKAPITDDSNLPVKCVIMFLTAKTGSAIYLQTLSSFISLVKDDERYERFLKSHSSDEVLEILDTIEVQKELSVRDIMSTNIVSVTPHTTVRELVDILFEHKISYVPVLDSSGALLGEITMNDLLKAGLPHYAIKIGNLDFLNHFQPFETLLANENSIHVETIMRKVSVSLTPKTSMIETALEMAKNNRRHLPVVEQNILKGIVSFMDILSKVLRF
ncbi:MAG: PTS sugar transporter subunit IIA [Deltaproteobacteria bacterium]|nr:PTS sugar transporter subunit IIA [Deltaproteobacteria bacterium]